MNMIDSKYHTRLNGNIAVTSHYHDDSALHDDTALYKFIFVWSGEIAVEVDHVKTVLHENEIMPLTPLHHLDIENVRGEYVTLLFNSNFYCIYGHDSDVSCNGFLFNGSSHVMVLQLSNDEAVTLRGIVNEFVAEMQHDDYLREEMLRMILKRFIIICTRIARNYYSIGADSERTFDIVRKFHVLVDNNFKEKKQVRDYADMLYRSPKTLSNLFAAYNIPSPLRIIHERVAAEAKRLLLYTDKSAKEIGDILGFEDIASFSRFFKRMEGISIMEFRRQISAKV